MTPVEVFIATDILYHETGGMVARIDPVVHKSESVCKESVEIYKDSFKDTDIEIKWIGCTPVVIPLTPTGDPT